MDLPKAVYENRFDNKGNLLAWDTKSVLEEAAKDSDKPTLRSVERALESSGFLPKTLCNSDITDERGLKPVQLVVSNLEAEAKRKRFTSLIIQEKALPNDGFMLFANDGRMGRRWLYVDDVSNSEQLLTALRALAGTKNLLVWPIGELTRHFRKLVAENGGHDIKLESGQVLRIGIVAYRDNDLTRVRKEHIPEFEAETEMSHLDRLEAESMHIIREVMTQAENPVMLYSIGKDSSVMLHLAIKAFYPSPPPFPLMHVDTRWKFQAMYEFRDEMARNSGMDLIVHINPEGVEKNVNPFDHGSALHTDIMKTQGLKQALDKYQFDVAFGGARRDEEKSRAKERVFSFRTPTHNWDPKNQRPEIWNLYNGYKTKGESIRVFPLSNWTELDIWQYIYREQIPIVPLYYAAERPVVERDGQMVLVDDDRMQILENEEIKIKRVRFRTLGCYPLTGAIESDADQLSTIVLELLENRVSERQGRAIDSDSSASMEKKKQEGYF